MHGDDNTPAPSPRRYRPTGRGGHNAGKQFKPKPLSRDEVERLMRAFRGGATGARNKALIAVLYRAGLRLSEATALLPEDVDLTAGTINIERGKGNKQRTVGLDSGGVAILERWLKIRAEKGLPDDAPIFCQMNGRPLAPQAVRRILKTAATRAGITRRVHVHGLRHTFAAEMAREGVPINVIQRSLGHARLATTAIYLDHIAPPDVIAATRARTWDFDPEAKPPASEPTSNEPASNPDAA